MDFIAKRILNSFAKFDENKKGLKYFLSLCLRRQGLGNKWFEKGVFETKVYTSNSGYKVVDSPYFDCENIWNTFIISDTHFFHFKEKNGIIVDNTIARYCDRPSNWEELIITNWNNVVKDDDTVLHLGDLTFGNIERTAAITRNLKGRKFLLKGNHDRRSIKWFDEVGFTLLKHPFMVDCGSFKIMFSHKPSFDLPKGTANIHGHWHNKSHFVAYRQGNLYINVSVEKINYSPIRMNNLMYISESRSESKIAI
jgi:calcineurin-like phosphoesterase family protein